MPEIKQVTLKELRTSMIKVRKEMKQLDEAFSYLGKILLDYTELHAKEHRELYGKLNELRSQVGQDLNVLGNQIKK